MATRNIRFCDPRKKCPSDEVKKTHILLWIEEAIDLHFQGIRGDNISNISYLSEYITTFDCWFEFSEEDCRDAVIAIYEVKQNYYLPSGYYFFYHSDLDAHNGGCDGRCKIVVSESYESLLEKMSEEEYAIYVENTLPHFRDI